MRISMRSCVDAATLALCSTSSQWLWDSDSCSTSSSISPFLSAAAAASDALLTVYRFICLGHSRGRRRYGSYRRWIRGVWSFSWEQLRFLFFLRLHPRHGIRFPVKGQMKPWRCPHQVRRVWKCLLLLQDKDKNQPRLF
jgi:hypothetical protein